jgi:NAD+ synthase (glutamine-hydrolysing)
MRIAIAQLNFHIGNFKGNLDKMLEAVEYAKQHGADVVCFSELATTGYPPRDFLEFDDFIRLAEKSVERLTTASDGIAIIVGSPTRNPDLEGKDLFNSAFFLADGKVKHIAHKALLPTYDIFDEYRYFEPGKQFRVFSFKGQRIALTICEDLWNIGNENPLYTTCPMDEMIHQKPDLLINISASPFSYDHAAERIGVMRANAERYKIPLFFINHCGAQTELIFDGGSMAISPQGIIVEEMEYFTECIRIFDVDEVKKARVEKLQSVPKITLVHDAIILGIKDYFGKLGFKTAVLGLSGGIDSAVTACMAVRALGSGNVTGILMPSQFSSEHSIHDAKELASNLEMPIHVIPIEEIYNSFLSALEPYFRGLPFNIAEENIQARIRAVFLMSFSNKFGHILLNTSNKSEAAVGYGTLYGDMCGGLAILGDVYKIEVYELANYLNREVNLIPEYTVSKPPSAELRHDQKDSDSLPDYTILDQILFQYIERELGPNEIVKLGFDEKLVRRILKLVNTNEFKRFQTPPILRVSSKAFGMGRRMPIVGKYLS